MADCGTRFSKGFILYMLTIYAFYITKLLSVLFSWLIVLTTFLNRFPSPRLNYTVILAWEFPLGSLIPLRVISALGRLYSSCSFQVRRSSVVTDISSFIHEVELYVWFYAGLSNFSWECYTDCLFLDRGKLPPPLLVPVSSSNSKNCFWVEHTANIRKEKRDFLMENRKNANFIMIFRHWNHQEDIIIKRIYRFAKINNLYAN